LILLYSNKDAFYMIAKEKLTFQVVQQGKLG